MENTYLRVIEAPVVKLVRASYGKRFANYAIDFLLFCIIVSFLLILVAPVYPLANKIMLKQPIGFAEQLLISFLYGLYMSVMEALLKGKSVGKFITGNRAVSESCLPLSAQTAFVRGLIRVIPFPFEQASAFSFSFEPFALRPPYPWHDRWSQSIVIDESASLLPKKR